MIRTGFFKANALTIIGMLLLVITFLGPLGIAGQYESFPSTPRNPYNADLVARTSNLDLLFQAARERSSVLFERLPPDQKMQLLYRIVRERLNHGDQAHHTLFSNWILWALGLINPNFSHIWDPDLLLKYGHSALCDQSSYVLLSLALKAGIRSRHVGLNGHVVMEAWYHNSWHMYDPDLNIIVRDRKGNVLGVRELSVIAPLSFSSSTGTKVPGQVIQLYESREDNNFVSYPIGARFIWKADILAIVESITGYLKWIIPGALVLLGIFSRLHTHIPEHKKIKIGMSHMVAK